MNLSSSHLDILFDSVPEGTTRRFNCPKCKHENTLSITKTGSEVKYNCFSASCTLYGDLAYKASLGSLKARFNARTEEEGVFSIPDYWVRGISSEKCFRMLLTTNSHVAYQKGMFQVAYDPREDRMVYLVQDDRGNIVGGVGRTLSFKKPKVLNYKGSAPMPFRAGKGSTVVLVEDCASACAVSEIPEYTGLALLGTNLKETYIPILKEYDKVVVALDYDARKKALDLKRSLCYYGLNVRVVILKQDLKDLEYEKRVQSLS